MRYEDASISSQGAGAPDARDDADALSAGSRGPATGNTITGEGTITGAAGADVVANGPGKIVALEGASGSDSDGDSMQVEGRFGELVMDSSGSYSYTPNAARPEGGSDVFRYTLADSEGARDSATLTIDIGREIEKIDANAQQIIVGPDGVVTLPPGVQLSDILVVGRNLVINLPDGTQMVIVDGAIFVPQLVLDGVEVPASNLAALLIDAEPKPAAGTPLSSGGNFAIPLSPLDPGVPLGDLIPPTQLVFTPPTFQEVGQFVDHEPEILIQPDGQPAVVNAVDSVDEKGLGPRGSEPPGSGEIADGIAGNNSDSSERTSGTIIVNSPDTPNSVTINGVAVTSVGQTIAGSFGTLTITSISPTAIGYTYTLTDNTSGNSTADNFTVSVEDNDGDVATATLVVDIVDDAPTARPDTDSIAAGTFGPATGNVISDSAPGDSGDGDSGADTVGADNATVTSISGAGGSDSTFSGGVLVVNGQYGVLTIDAAGNYSYVRNAGTPGGVTDTFNYTITDGDGDPSSSTLTISIADATPRTGDNPTVLLDDDALAGGNAGGTGDDADAANTSGTLAGSGGDGALTFDLLTSGAPAGFTYVDGPGGSILVQQGGVTVLTITLNASTGAYTVTQNAAIDHAALGDENNAGFTINYTVTDVDGDPASGTLTINVDDDTPTITRQDVSAPTLAVDETDLSANATGNFATLFAVSYGADGAGTTSYSVSVVNGTDSGLDDVATGQDILLFNNGGVVEGRVGGASGAVAFTVGVNAATGVVTLDQVRALEHPDATNPDDPVSPTASAIQFTVNAVDGDGDPISQTINIGGNLVFDDDGPSLTNAAAASSVLLDETAAGTPAGFPISTTSASAMITAAQAFGADGPAASGSAVYGLSLSGSASGLQTAVGDHAITLVQVDGDTVEGRYNGTNVAFTIQMNADGTVTVTQNVPLEHVVDGPPGPAHDDPLDLDNLVNATVTITDRDGDSANAAVAIGDNIVFEDDGPSIDVTAGADSGVVLTTDDSQTSGGASDTAASTANFSGVFGLTFAGGADGASTPSLNYTLGVSVQGVNSGLTQGGAAIYLYVIGGEVVGSTSATQAGVSAANSVFDVSVDSGGTVTLTQFSQIDHPIGSDPTATGAPFADHVVSLADGLVTLTASATVTDNDGDFASDSATVAIGANLRFTDDGPALSNVVAGPGVTLDETTAGTPAGFPISGTSASAAISATQAFGADGPAASGSAVYGLTLVGSASGLQTAIGDHAITLVQVDSDTIEGRYNGTNVAFTIQMNANGTVTLTQNVPLEHVVDGGTAATHDDALNLAGLVNATVTITDFDGDTATASVGIGGNLVFKDDGPDAQVDGTASADVLVLDETIPVGTETDGDSDPAGLATVQSNFANNFVSPADHGADGPGTVTYSLVLSGSNVVSGLWAVDPSDISATDGDGYGRGAQILLNQSGNTITGSVGGVDYFTITINSATGIVTFTQLQPIWHANTASDDDTSTLTAAAGSLLVRQTVTDSDGDFDTADIDVSTGTFQIEDDGPVAVNDGDNVAGPGGTATGNVITDSEGDGGADDVGADVPGRITSISGFGGSDTSFDGSGNLQVNGQYGVLTINAAGAYTYTRTDGLGGGQNDVFTYTLTDGDGDSTTATLTISIADAVPVLATPTAVQLDDDNAVGVTGNAGGTGDDDVSGTSGTLSATGGDGDIDFFFSATQTAPAGFTYNLVNPSTLQILQGSTVVATVSLNNETGDYSVTQNNPVVHDTLNGVAGDDTENNTPNFNVSLVAKDIDNDSSNTVNLVINIDDDTPTISASATQPVLAVDETNLAANAGPTSFASVFTVSFGADGPAASNATTYALGINAGSTGIVDTATGQAVVLSVNGSGQVEGRTATSGALVFVVSVDGSGNVTLDQQRAVVHNDPNDHDEPGASAVTLAADTLITLTATVTDKDGDSVSATANIGQNLQFEDDGPDAVNDGTTQTTENSAVTVNVFANDAAGADGVNLATGIAVVPSSLTGTGTLVYNNNGTFTYTPGTGEQGTVTFQYRLTDRDGDSDVATVTITLQPDSTPSATAETALLDDDGLGGNASADVNDIDANATQASGADGNSSEAIWSGTLNASFGADTPGSFSFSSSLNGTTAVIGQETVTYTVTGGGTLLTANITTTPDSTRLNDPLFQVQITNAATGAYTVTLLDNVLHATRDTLADDNTENLPANDASVTIPFTATDSDGNDSTTANLSITFDDDMASIGTVTNPLAIANSGIAPSATGTFQFIIGADNNTGNDDFRNVTLNSVTVYSSAGASQTGTLLDVTEGAETATGSTWNFSFHYLVGGVDTTATGTIVFNKSTQQYTVTLTSGPIQGFSSFETAAGTAFVGYERGTATIDSSQPAVAVTTIQAESTAGAGDGFFVQFTGIAEEPGDTDHEAINSPPPPNYGASDGDAHTWSPGELFAETELPPAKAGQEFSNSWVSVSGSSNGVAGDTVQGPEVLDFNLYSSNPTGVLGQLPTQSADNMFMVFDGIGDAEDLIVILKLWSDTNGNGEIDAVGDSFTTKAVIVQNADIYRFNAANIAATQAALTGTQYEDIMNDIIAGSGSSNDGLVIIESNDYNSGGSTYKIIGAQIVDSEQGVSGSGIDLVRAVGASGGSSGAQAFSVDSDEGPLKITNIGFVQTTATTQSAQLNFTATVSDADGDAASTTFNVNVGTVPTTTSSSTVSTMMVSQESLSETSLLTSESQDQQRSMSAANNNSVLLGAIAAAGLGIGTAAAAQDFTPPGLEAAVEMMSTGDGGAVVLSTVVEQGNSVGNGFAGETREALDAAPGGSPTGHSASAGTQSLTAGEEASAEAPAELDAGTESGQPDSGQSGLTSAGVAMPSAAMLAEANANDNGLDGQAQGKGEVGRVLADALAGGNGPDIDAVLDAVTNQAPGGPAALEALASHGPAGVSGWHTAGFAGFPGGHGAVTVEPMLHHDAVPAA